MPIILIKMINGVVTTVLYGLKTLNMMQGRSSDKKKVMVRFTGVYSETP
jgi:hypothetical protein